MLDLMGFILSVLSLAFGCFGFILILGIIVAAFATPDPDVSEDDFDYTDW